MKKLQYTKISSEEQYNRYCEILRELLFEKPDSKGGAVENKSEHIELLSLLIQTWNDEQFKEEEYDPITLLKSLMKDHGLKQKHIAEICDVNKSFVSEVLNYKKYLSKKMIRSIADYFKIRQATLNKSYKLTNKVVYVVGRHHMYLESHEHNWFEHSRESEYSREYDKQLIPDSGDGIFKLDFVGDC